MISHDRTLLDRVCNQIWELDKGNIRVLTEITPTGPPKRNGNGASRSLNTSSTRRRKAAGENYRCIAEKEPDNDKAAQTHGQRVDALQRRGRGSAGSCPKQQNPLS